MPEAYSELSEQSEIGQVRPGCSLNDPVPGKNVSAVSDTLSPSLCRHSRPGWTAEPPPFGLASVRFNANDVSHRELVTCCHVPCARNACGTKHDMIFGFLLDPPRHNIAM